MDKYLVPQTVRLRSFGDGQPESINTSANVSRPLLKKANTTTDITLTIQSYRVLLFSCGLNEMNAINRRMTDIWKIEWLNAPRFWRHRRIPRSKLEGNSTRGSTAPSLTWH